jgi:hypothetical protein
MLDSASNVTTKEIAAGFAERALILAVGMMAQRL